MPSILRAVPRRWGAKPTVCVALMLTLTSGMAGCARPGPPETPQDLSALSIPVFAHGDGFGSYGCVSVAPPVFLSEDEAKQVIRDEAESYGIHFDETRVIESTKLPATSLSGFPGQDQGKTRSGMLKLDGYDPAYNLSFEFVSQSDVRGWTADSSSMMSAESYDMKGTAERLAEALPGTAVFYDPGADYDAFSFDGSGTAEEYEAVRAEYEASQRKRMLEDLRQQVRDFLAWLSAEGII